MYDYFTSLIDWEGGISLVAYPQPDVGWIAITKEFGILRNNFTTPNSVRFGIMQSPVHSRVIETNSIEFILPQTYNDTNIVGTTQGGFIFRRKLHSGTGSLHGPGIYSPASTSNRCSVHLPWSDNNMYWDYGGVSSGRLSIAMPAETLYQPTTWGFNSGARGMEIWRNGFLYHSGGSPVTRAATTNGFTVNKWDSAGTGMTGEVDLYILYNEQPPATVMARLTANPMDIFHDGILGLGEAMSLVTYALARGKWFA